MRAVIHDYAGFPFPFDLSCELANRGYDVLHLYTTGCGGPKAAFKEEKNLKVSNISIKSINKDKFTKRWFQERKYGDLVTNVLKQWKPDIVVSANAPLEAQRKIFNWTDKNSIPTVFWLQDLLSLAVKSIIKKKIGFLGGFPASYFRKIEVDALKKASHIVSISDDFLSALKTWEIDPQKISIISNWAPIEDIPVYRRKNYFSDKYNLNKKFVVLYAGTLGMKQDPRLIIKTARMLSIDKEIIFLIATDERGHRYLNNEKRLKKPPNLLQIPLQSFKDFPYMLAAADVSLVVLGESAASYCVPSKIWSSFCAAKPSIVVMDKTNLIARVTDKIHAGRVTTPGSAKECAAAIKHLKQNKKLRTEMGYNGRRYAEKNFSISKITSSFEQIFQSIII